MTIHTRKAAIIALEFEDISFQTSRINPPQNELNSLWVRYAILRRYVKKFLKNSRFTGRIFKTSRLQILLPAVSVRKNLKNWKRPKGALESAPNSHKTRTETGYNTDERNHLDTPIKTKKLRCPSEFFVPIVSSLWQFRPVFSSLLEKTWKNFRSQTKKQYLGSLT